jgi:hypothetical protein
MSAPSRASRSYRFTTSAGGTSQQAVVCISCSGMAIEPQPTFSWVWYLIFLNMVTFHATITSPRCRIPAGGWSVSSKTSSTLSVMPRSASV